MLRSLATRLILAFALTSLVGIGLAALLVRQFVTNEFDTFLLEQQRNELLAQLITAYQETGDWNAATAILNGRSDREGGDPFVPIEVADTEGRIVLSDRPAEIGRSVDPELLSRGTPIMLNGEQIGTLLPLPPPRRNPAEERYLSRIDLALGGAAFGALCIAIVLGFLLAQVITRPLRELMQGVRAIATGDLSRRVPVRSRDELGALAHQFNTMSAELQRATELRRRMTADIAHDLRTPLTVIAGYLEALRDAELPATPARFAAMHTETQTLLRLVEDLHTLSLADAGELPLRCREIAVDDLLERIVRIYNDAAQQAGIRLYRQSEPAGMRIYGDEEQLVRALSNLVSNALRYTPEGGEIVIEATRQGHQIMLSVQDTGPGIPPEHLPNVFERFYRIDESRHTGSGGSGLGLAIVRSIAQAHNGTATVHSTPGAGACFTIALPAETKNVVPVP